MFEFSRPALPQFSFPVDFSNSLDTLASFVNQLQGAIALAIQHPILAILILLVSIGLIQLIADLIKRLIKTSITFILTLPLNLSQWLWKRATTPSAPSKEAQIEQLIDRLDTLRAEEAHIITELKSLLAADKVSQPIAKVLTAITAKAGTEKTGTETVDTRNESITGTVEEKVEEKNAVPES